MRVVLVLVIVFVLIVTGVVLFFTFSSNGDDIGLGDEVGVNNGENIGEGGENIVSEEISGNEENGGGGQGGGGSSSSGGGSSSSSGGLSGFFGGDCNSREISYISYGLITNEECLLYNGQACVEKNVVCSVNIQNLDSDAGGLFDIEFIYYILQDVDETGFISGIWSDNEITRITDEIEIGAGEVGVAETTYNVESLGIQGIANQEIKCIYNVVNAPIKKICLSPEGEVVSEEIIYE